MDTFQARYQLNHKDSTTTSKPTLHTIPTSTGPGKLYMLISIQFAGSVKCWQSTSTFSCHSKSLPIVQISDWHTYIQTQQRSVTYLNIFPSGGSTVLTGFINVLHSKYKGPVKSQCKFQASLFCSKYTKKQKNTAYLHGYWNSLHVIFIALHMSN